MTAFERLGKDVATALRSGPGPERRGRQRAALMAVDWQRRQRLKSARWLVPLAAAAAIVLVAVALVRRAGTAGETLEIAGDPALDAGKWLHASDARRVRLRFTDGTELDLEPRSTGRLIRRSESEAGLVLEGGRLTAEVVKSAVSGRRWRFDAGLYEVLVLGTRVHIQWSSEKGRLSVDVERGEVQVRGGQLERPGLFLGAGDRLEVHSGRIDLQRARGAESHPRQAVAPEPSAATRASVSAASVPPDDPGPEAMDSGPAATEPEKPSGGDVPGAKESWKALARAGRYKEALIAAEQHGFDSLVLRLPAADLALLADAARLSGNGGQAKSALLTLRRRFGGTGEAALAAFRLGRLALTRQSYGDAARWFQTYLAQAPSGQLADEAMGRLIEAQARSGNPAGARASASQYVRRFPGGSYESLARGLLDGGELEQRPAPRAKDR